MTATLSAIVPPNVTADMLTALIAQHPASESRINRGAALVRANHVESTTTAGVVLVRSASTDNRAYRVDAYACGCMDHQSREIFCQHMAARALWLAGMRAETDAEQAIDADAPIALELTGRTYLTLLPTAALPAPVNLPRQCSKCHAEDATTRHPEGLGMACISVELYGGDAA